MSYSNAAIIDLPRMAGFPEEHLPTCILHPVQYHDVWTGSGTSPERELAAAVLDRAATDLRLYRHARKKRHQRLYVEAYQWVASDDTSWPFNFLSICHAIGVSPAALRERLLDPQRGRETREAA
ncbi:MAG: hypothetical protein SF182_01855 [Deltaproteobacteria bacterium]|nr:hypothetical protein [Deltaproteobacteria bacterium]